MSDRSLASRARHSLGSLGRLLFVVFYLEVGFALLIVPWSTFWDRNYFALKFPPVHAVITNDFVRGAVSGIGVVNIGVGISELVAMLMARRQESELTTLRSWASKD